MATLDGGWRRLVSEIGVEFGSTARWSCSARPGRRSRTTSSASTPTSCSSRWRRRRASFDVQARNPANTVHIGDDAMAFGAVYGPPFVREGEVRRDATMDDFRNFARLAQSFSVHRLGGRDRLRAGGHAAGLAGTST